MAKILLVDDEEDVRVSVKHLLVNAGHTIITASDGEKALATLAKDTFDLVILDILMPQMRGTEVLEKIRKDPKLKDQKVVFFSVSRPTEYDKKVIKELNPLAFLTKPVDIDELLKVVKGLA